MAQRTSNSAAFDEFFDRHFVAVVATLSDVHSSPAVGLREARSAFASVYRFWRKIGPRADKLEWVFTDAIGETRAHEEIAKLAAADHDDLPTQPQVISLSYERRRVMALALRRRTFAAVALGAFVLLMLAAEVFVAGR